MTTRIETEALVIGAGPVGLFQVFQLGLQGIACQVVDALPHVGGQCAELYADKPIYDIPGIPVCTGRELVARLQQQIAPFPTSFHLGQQVKRIERQSDGRLQVDTTAGKLFLASTVFIAAGVGAFVPRHLMLDGLDAFLGTQVFAEDAQPSRWAGQHLVVAGDGDAALQTCLQACEGTDAAASVTLLHRRDQFSAQPELVTKMREACAAGRMRFAAGQPTGLRAEGGRLQALELLNPQGETVVVAAAAVAPAGVQAPVYEKFNPQNAGQYRFVNAGTNTVFLGTGASAAEATANAVAPVAGNPSPAIVLVPGAVEIIRFNKDTYFSGLAAAATTVYVTPGQGL